MSITIPDGGRFQDSEKPWLTPQVLVDINLEDFDRITTDPITTGGISVETYDRVINAEIQLIYISADEISAQLEKVLGSIAIALVSDLNPSDRGSKGHIESIDTAINPMNFQFGLQIDNTQQIQYVSVWIQSKKLKTDYAIQAFTRVKNYVADALIKSH